MDPDQRFKILLVYHYTRSSSSMQKKKVTKPCGFVVIGVDKTIRII
jgi:hypothetical protein